ncbi:thioredoxin-like protein [Thiogranum longum]|uniref:Thioredoxin-like protein n=1 Tax=Thiogranum longum TaxID=1537524 RepID=A0A4V2PGG3_9GAMM|nr:thioredoxin fold domain-containing protein [Thiogranum longum]TCK16816.1 thioredoxin-like protein [Thiogranum longum]
MTDKWCKWPHIMAGIFLLVANVTRAAVPLAQDLQKDGRQAERYCAPVLLEFAAEYCDYCMLLEHEILDPTLLDRDYDRRVLMRKIMIDGNRRLLDFNGKTIDERSIATHYKVWVTPTVLFVDRNGMEIAKRLVGISSVDFYGGYLDAALDESRRRLQELGRCDP